MKTITTAGDTALQRLDELRSGWRPGGEYPFIIGIDEELQQLRDMIEPPTDGGNAILQAAFDFDVEAWLKAKGPKATKSWPKQAIPPQTTIALPSFIQDIITDVNIYPNPVRDIIYLESDENWSKAEIFDVSGRILRSVSLDGQSIDVNGLESGTYFVRLRDGEKVGVVKFVKL